MTESPGEQDTDGAATDTDSVEAPEEPQNSEHSTETEGDREPTDSVEYWKRRARENETRAKENHRELEQLRRDSMSESERAVAEARDAARTEAFAEVSGRLVDAEVRTSSANRPVNVDALLDGLDRSRFVTEDGEVDREAVTRWLDQLAPVQEVPRTASDLGQGARGVNRSSPDEMFGDLIANKIRR